MNHLSGTPLYVHINIPDVNVMCWLLNTMGWDKTGNPVSFHFSGPCLLTSYFFDSLFCYTKYIVSKYHSLKVSKKIWKSKCREIGIFLQKSILTHHWMLCMFGKVHIFWEGHKILRNLQPFDWHYIGQIYGGDFTKFCGLLRIYEL